jgi:hypothetical protein
MKTESCCLILASALFAGVACAQAPAKAPASQEDQIKAYVNMLRKDVRGEWQTIVDQAMGLEAGDKAKFWGVYDGYQKDMKALWDRRLANIKLYAENFDKMTDPVADKIAAAAMTNEQDNVAIRRKYYGQVKSAVGSKAAARFWQVETLLGQLIGLQLGAELPLMD